MNIADGGIVIVGQPRSGSSNLQRSICSYYSKKLIFEPNFMLEEDYDPNKDVVKVFPYHPAYYNQTQHFDYLKILNKIKQFNTIILLSRRNKKEQVESFYNTVENLDGSFNLKWEDNNIDSDSETYKFYERYFVEADKIHNRISSDLNLEINYFEDVFKNKKLNIDIGLDLEYFSKKFKLRQYVKNQSTLI